MEVNINNKKCNYVEKSIIKLNDISPSFINILKEEYIGINTYHIDYYLDNDNKLKPSLFILLLMMFMNILKKIMVRNILIVIILIIIKRF